MYNTRLAELLIDFDKPGTDFINIIYGFQSSI